MLTILPRLVVANTVPAEARYPTRWADQYVSECGTGRPSSCWNCGVTLSGTAQVQLQVLYCVALSCWALLVQIDGAHGNGVLAGRSRARLVVLRLPCQPSLLGSQLWSSFRPRPNAWVQQLFLVVSVFCSITWKCSSQAPSRGKPLSCICSPTAVLSPADLYLVSSHHCHRRCPSR